MSEQTVNSQVTDIVVQSNPSCQQVTEIHFTDEQAARIQRAIETEIQEEQGRGGFLMCVKHSLLKIGYALVGVIVGIIKLKDTGKWVSVLTIGLILNLIYQFLHRHNFSIEAMQIVLPTLSQLGTVVFSVIGGFMGLNKLAENTGTIGAIVQRVRDMLPGGQAQTQNSSELNRPGNDA